MTSSTSKNLFDLKTIALCTVFCLPLLGCGGGGSDSSSSGNNTAPINTPSGNNNQNNLPPIANAGVLQSTLTGTVVSLDGSASTDANSDSLTYLWALTSKPAGSLAALNSTNSPKPTFTADIAGDYVATLIVSDGKANSQESSVTIKAATTNAAPVANAGVPQNIVVGSTVMLDGSTSSDANLDALTYSWVLTSKPAGSTAVLSNPNSDKPTFATDIAGDYVTTLIVSDGKANSQESSVTIKASAANAAPVAFAGVQQSIVAGSTVTLNGSASSDANSDVLTYTWVLTSKPVGSAAVLSSTNSDKPTFVADIAGDYVATLIVNDGKINSTPSTIVVSAMPSSESIAFNTLYDSLKTIFTKSTFETTVNFEQRAQTELAAQKTYKTISTPSTYNIAGVSYNADVQKAKFTFYIGCRSGDGGEPCSPPTGIKMHEVRGTTINNTSSNTMYLLSISNMPVNFSNGVEVSVSPIDAPDLVNGNFQIVAEFKLDSTIPVSTSMSSLLMPTSNYQILTSGGFRYYYTYPSINATVIKLVFVSRTTGKILATYMF